MKRIAVLVSASLLAACATTPRTAAPITTEVQILAFNDLHGNLEPPQQTVPAPDAAGQDVPVPAGGAAYLAGALKQLRTSNSITVSAGDLIGATPLASAYFLDEPTIHALNAAGLDLNAVGNHEFDKGIAELERMQKGGCEKHATREPCAVERFEGARFGFLAANVVKRDGSTLFPGTAIRQFGPVKIGFIGMTLKETATLVTPAGVAGVNFLDEAATANAAVPALKAAGADAIVLLIHQGGRIDGRYDDPACPGLRGDIMPIIERLDPAIGLIVSGHTHNAYICRVPTAGGERLLTSAGRYGAMLTDIRLRFEGERLAGQTAKFEIVQGEPYRNGSVALTDKFPVYPADPAVRAVVDRYVEAVKAPASRVVGRLSGEAPRAPGGESPAANLTADAQLAASRGQGAQIAFINEGGIRTDLQPAADGTVNFGQIFQMQPFGNSLVVKDYTGAELKAVLEQQFDSGSNSLADPNFLIPSANFSFGFDLSRPTGERIRWMKLDGKDIDLLATYRITFNNFLASGGDNFTALAVGRNAADAGSDIDAIAAWLARGQSVPPVGRIVDLTPKDWVAPKL